MTGRARAMCVTVVALGWVLSASAFDQRPLFRSRVNGVRLDCLATDHGRPISGLTAADFEVFDNGARQQVEMLPTVGVPLDVTFVFDTSASVRGTVLDNLKLAADAVIDVLKASDRVALWTFSQRIDARRNLTTNFGSIRQAIGDLSGQGATSMFDALYAAVASRPEGPNRSLALLFTDGKDNRSWLDQDEVIQAATQLGTLVYVVAFNTPFELAGDADRVTGTGPDKRVLERIANETGGRLLWTERDRDLKQRFVEVLQEMRSRYLLVYRYSAEPEPGWHTIKVRLTRRSGSVKARSGYLVARINGRD